MNTDSTALKNRLKKNLKQIKPYLKQNNISCYRVYDWDMPEFPLCIDMYESRVHVAEYLTRHALEDDAYENWVQVCRDVLKEVFSLEDDQLFFKLRKKHGVGSQYEKLNEEKVFFSVKENDITFLVNLGDYLDTGLFLDHRPLRKQVMLEAKNKHVLNLFAYTGSFSVYAAMGGAFTTTTVDLSNTYLNWAKENFRANQISLAKHSFIKTDVKEWIKQKPSRLYDIIILDPPTVSKSKMAKTKFDVQTDHVELIQSALTHLHPNGVLYFSNNFRDFKIQEDIPGAQITDISLQTIPADFRNKKIHYCWKIQHAKR